jgi:heat shock protein HslJ
VGHDAEPGRLLVGREWVLESIGGEDVTVMRPASLRFGDDGRVTGSTGVNRMFGGYDITDGRLSITTPGTTLMAGPPDAMATETAFLRALAGGGEVAVDGDRLTIGDGETRLTLRPRTARSPSSMSSTSSGGSTPASSASSARSTSSRPRGTATESFGSPVTFAGRSTLPPNPALSRFDVTGTTWVCHTDTPRTSSEETTTQGRRLSRSIQ